VPFEVFDDRRLAPADSIWVRENDEWSSTLSRQLALDVHARSDGMTAVAE